MSTLFDWVGAGQDQFIAIRRPASRFASGLSWLGPISPPTSMTELFRALEVADLDLSGVELVTLSACKSGLGESLRGEGLQGLQRALQVAGAQTAIASLWSVPDRATPLLMERFYDHLWSKRMSKLEALREAQLWFIEKQNLLSIQRSGTHDRISLTTVPKTSVNR